VEIQLLKKYIRGECSQEEAEMVQRWIDSDDFNDQLLFNIEKDLHQYVEYDRIENKDALKTALLDVYERGASNYANFSKHRKFYSNSLFKIAASFALLIASAFFVQQLLVKTNHHVEVAEGTKIIKKENDRGRKSSIFLPDGSIVFLNSESSIQYDELSFTNNREIFLTGEGFFEVAKDSLHPFKVIASNIEITALGTSFNVNSYKKDQEISVALVTGKVLVKIADSTDLGMEYFLNPGQEINYITAYNQFTYSSSFNPKEIYGWKDGILYFEQANLADVLQKLERWFDVDFEIKNASPVEWRYTAQFHNQNLRNILESLSFSQNFKYELNGKKVTIEFNPNNQ
jgi:transmembrane sensor